MKARHWRIDLLEDELCARNAGIANASAVRAAGVEGRADGADQIKDEDGLR